MTIEESIMTTSTHRPLAPATAVREPDPGDPALFHTRAHTLMYVVGVIEIVAGLVVLVRPRFGAYLVAAWLAGIIFSLLLMADFYDVALRDFGLLLAALSLARLATVFPSGLRTTAR
jgi:hypothetical protein